MWKHKTPRPLHQVILPPSLLSSDQAFPVGLYPEDDGSAGPASSPATLGCSLPSGTTTTPTTKKHRCLRKSGKGAGEEGSEERAGGRSPKEHWWGLNNLIWAPFHIFILKSPRLSEERRASSWDMICQSKCLQILFPNSAVILDVFVLLLNGKN